MIGEIHINSFTIEASTTAYNAMKATYYRHIPDIIGTGTMSITKVFMKFMIKSYDKRQRRRYMRNYKLGLKKEKK